MVASTARFGPFLPDLAGVDAGGSDLVRNVIPGKSGYTPARRVAPFTSALAEPALTARFFKSIGGAFRGFVGTETTLQEIDGTGFSDVSRVANYATGAGETWDFAQFGDRVFATNFSDEVQDFVLSSSTEFADAGGGIPQCRYLAVVNNFLFTANLNEGGTLNPFRVRWSAQNDATSFPDPGTTAAVQVLADRQDLPADFGVIRGIEGGLISADALVIQEQALQRVVRVADRAIFSFDVIEGARGTFAAGSVVKFGGEVYYIADNGIFKTDGARSVPIGASQVDNYLFRTLDSTRPELIKSTFDPRRKLVIWAIPTSDDEDVAGTQLIYNWDIQEWSYIEGQTIQAFARTIPTGVSFDDAAFASVEADDIEISVDIDIWKGGGLPVFSAFNAQSQLGPFDGGTLEAVVETAEIEPEQDHRAYVQFTRPLVDAVAATVQAITRNRLAETKAVGPSKGLNAEGRAQTRVKARYIAFRLTIPEGIEWSILQGIQAVHEIVGRRTPTDAETPLFQVTFLLTDDGQLILTDEGVKTTFDAIEAEAPEPEPEVQDVLTTDALEILQTDQGESLEVLG